MPPQDFILWLVAFAVGVHSWIWRNPTAVALVLAYMVAQAGLPLELYAYSDAVVITVVMMKLERSSADRFILLCYPLAWLSYVFDSPLSSIQWWHLFAIAIAQFTFTAAEPWLPYIRRRFVEAVERPEPPGLLLVACGVGGDG